MPFETEMISKTLAAILAIKMDVLKIKNVITPLFWLIDGRKLSERLGPGARGAYVVKTLFTLNSRDSFSRR